MRTQSSIEFLLIAIAAVLICFYVIYLFSKDVFPQASTLSRTTNLSSNTARTLSNSLVYASANASTAYSVAYSAILINRKEKFAYGIGHESYVVNLTQFSHCAAMGFFGHAFNVTDQCGTPNAWDYLAGYRCWTSGAFCIVPRNTSYGVEQISAQRVYVYNFTLSLESPYGTFSTNISSAGSEFPVMGAGGIMGYASVSGVVSVEPASSYTIYTNGSSYSQVNQSAYARYVQEKNTLFPMLSFYNGTDVDSGTQEAIAQTVNAFAGSANALITSSTAPLGCDVANNIYVCGATYPFYYVINVTLSPTLLPANQTLFYLGSVIRVVN